MNFPSHLKIDCKDFLIIYFHDVPVWHITLIYHSACMLFAKISFKDMYTGSVIHYYYRRGGEILSNLRLPNIKVEKDSLFLTNCHCCDTDTGIIY